MKIACNCAKPAGIGTTGATIAAALMPNFACPLCWPLYAAFFGAIGIPLTSANWLFTAMTAALTISIVLMLLRSPEERAPALLAVASAVTVLAFRLFDLPRVTCYRGQRWTRHRTAVARHRPALRHASERQRLNESEENQARIHAN